MCGMSISVSYSRGYSFNFKANALFVFVWFIERCPVEILTQNKIFGI